MVKILTPEQKSAKACSSAIAKAIVLAGKANVAIQEACVAIAEMAIVYRNVTPAADLVNGLTHLDGKQAFSGTNRASLKVWLETHAFVVFSAKDGKVSAKLDKANLDKLDADGKALAIENGKAALWYKAKADETFKALDFDTLLQSLLDRFENAANDTEVPEELRAKHKPGHFDQVKALVG